MVQFATDSMTREAGLGLARAISLHGMRTPSLKAIGETMGASVPTVHRWLGGGQRRLARVVGAHLGVIIDVMRDRTGARGAAGFMPCADAELFPIRTLLAFEEMGRTDDSVAEQVAEAWRQLHVILRNTVRRSDVGREAAILRGLWASVCDGHAPMALDDACRIWTDDVVSRRDASSG
ncbi:hypothetical protein ABTZ46_08355 [Nocardioides sp. NPDC126508]